MHSNCCYGDGSEMYLDFRVGMEEIQPTFPPLCSQNCISLSCILYGVIIQVLLAFEVRMDQMCKMTESRLPFAILDSCSVQVIL